VYINKRVETFLTCTIKFVNMNNNTHFKDEKCIEYTVNTEQFVNEYIHCVKNYKNLSKYGLYVKSNNNVYLIDIHSQDLAHKQVIPIMTLHVKIIHELNTDMFEIVGKSTEKIIEKLQNKSILITNTKPNEKEWEYNIKIHFE